jgi:N6-adenosine-specific RNA methylase IME4
VLWAEVREQQSVDAILAMQGRLVRLLRTLPDVSMPQLRESAEREFDYGAGAPRPCIIYADPPWSYEGGASHMNAAARHYTTMSDEQLAALPVAGLAGEDCALLMWATFPKLQSALRVMAAWGFEYKTVFLVWVKVRRYMARLNGTLGRYTQPNSEVLLLGMRGNMAPTACYGFARCNVLMARARGHSRKPDLVRQIAVELFGDYPRIELFARYPGPPRDWHGWGNQLAAEQDDDDDGSGGDDDDDDERDDVSAKRRRRTAATFSKLETFGAHESLGPIDYPLPDNLPTVVPAVMVARLDQFFAPETPRVHATYTPLTAADIEANIDVVRMRQRRNANALFAHNYQTK